MIDTDYIYITLFLIFINFLMYLLKDSFYEKFLPVDQPSDRKIHSKPILISGGLIFYINLILVLFISNFANQVFINFDQIKISFFVSITALFFLGILDDKINLNSTLKLFLIIIILYFFLTKNNNFLISELKFSFSEKSVSLGTYSIFFTILCIALFINAFNMFDGINLQSGFYSLFFFIFFLLK